MPVFYPPAAPSGGSAPPILPRVSGRWYVGDFHVFEVDGGGTLTNGTAELMPFRVGGSGQSLDRLGLNIATAGAAGSVIRVGIYGSSATTGLPDALTLDGGTVAADVAADSNVTISVTLPAGLYWLVMVANDASGTLRVRKSAGSSQAGRHFVYGSGGLGVDDMGYSLRTTGWTAGSALPSTASLTGMSTRRFDIPLLWVRAV